MKRLTMNEDGQFSATGKIEDKFYKTPLHELMAALLQEISILGRSGFGTGIDQLRDRPIVEH